jgi:small neutral amino acid transporter SnatA (MarC family)
MNMFGMTWEEIFVLLLTAMGPVGITMTYMPIAQALPPDMQRQLARRTILVGFIVAVVLMLLGGGVVQKFHLNPAVLLMGVGVTYFVQALPILLAGPSDLSALTEIKEPRRLAISPLAVPALISPLAVALLLSVSVFVPSLTATLIFVGMVGAVLIIDLGLMLSFTYVAQYLTKPILEMLQKIFGFIMLTFGIQLVLQALAKLGILTATGF